MLQPHHGTERMRWWNFLVVVAHFLTHVEVVVVIFVVASLLVQFSMTATLVSAQKLDCEWW